MGWVIPLVLLIVFEGVADILAKEWAIRGKFTWWLLAIGGYVVANTFWLFAIRNGSGLTRGAIIFSVGSAILAVAIGLLLYREGSQPHAGLGSSTGLGGRGADYLERLAS